MAETDLTDAQAEALQNTKPAANDFRYGKPGRTYPIIGIQRQQRMLAMAAVSDAGRVFKDGTLTFGVRAMAWLNGDTLVEKAQADAQALTDDTTNYIYYTASGTLTKNTTGFPTPSTTPHIRLATILTASGTFAYTDITDKRQTGAFRGSGSTPNKLSEDLDTNGNKITTAANADLILDPHGTGALRTSDDGEDARGEYAVDMQQNRGSASEVASGNKSTVSGGYGNTAGGADAVVGGGNENISNGAASTVSGGDANSTVADDSTIGGGNANSIGSGGDYSTIGGGKGNETTKEYSSIPGGLEAIADKYGQVAAASGRFASDGDAQGTIQMVARAEVAHSDANWHDLFLDGSSAKMTIGTDTVWTFDILLVGTTQGCVKSFGFHIRGVIKNDGGSTSLLNSTITTEFDGDDTDFDAQVVADDTNDCLTIQVKDSTSGGDTVRWVATVRTAEIKYAA